MEETPATPTARQPAAAARTPVAPAAPAIAVCVVVIVAISGCGDFFRANPLQVSSDGIRATVNPGTAAEGGDTVLVELHTWDAEDGSLEEAEDFTEQTLIASEEADVPRSDELVSVTFPVDPEELGTHLVSVARFRAPDGSAQTDVSPPTRPAEDFGEETYEILEYAFIATLPYEEQRERLSDEMREVALIFAKENIENHPLVSPSARVSDLEIAAARRYDAYDAFMVGGTIRQVGSPPEYFLTTLFLGRRHENGDYDYGDLGPLSTFMFDSKPGAAEIAETKRVQEWE
jgi:hypothetical protein